MHPVRSDCGTNLYRGSITRNTGTSQSSIPDYVDEFGNDTRGIQITPQRVHDSQRVKVARLSRTSSGSPRISVNSSSTPQQATAPQMCRCLVQADQCLLHSFLSRGMVSLNKSSAVPASECLPPQDHQPEIDPEHPIRFRAVSPRQPEPSAQDLVGPRQDPGPVQTANTPKVTLSNFLAPGFKLDLGPPLPTVDPLLLQHLVELLNENKADPP